MNDVRTTVPVLIVAGVMTALELAIVLPTLHGALQIRVALAVHALICACCALWVRKAAWIYADLSRPLLLLILTAMLGPAGSACTIIVLLLTAWNARSSTPFEEWYRALFPNVEQDEQMLLWEQIMNEQDQGEGHMVPAFTDVLTFGTVPQKQTVLALVNRRFRPELGPILKRALTDEENAIRVQAATAISRLETQFLHSTLRLTKQIAAAPEDPVLLLEMAGLCDDFGFAGILDARRQSETRETALTYYRRYLALKDDTQVMLTVARQELRLGNYGAAFALLERAGETGWTDQSILWRIECLYGMKQYEDARTLARTHEERLVNSTCLPTEAAQAVKLWAAGVEA